VRRALIVVDMQQGSFPEPPLRHGAEALVQRLNALASRVRRDGGLVIFVQHEGASGDPHHPGTRGFELLPDLEAGEHDLRIAKSSCDAFLGTGLEDALCAGGIDELIITGRATDFCVDTTVRAALGKSYPTIVPSDGHMTGDRPYLSAAKIVEHHNAVWAEFIAPGGPARLCLCEEV
jgi:nicotinamidase-related amidase